MKGLRESGRDNIEFRILDIKFAKIKIKVFETLNINACLPYLLNTHFCSHVSARNWEYFTTLGSLSKDTIICRVLFIYREMYFSIFDLRRFGNKTIRVRVINVCIRARRGKDEKRTRWGT